VRVRQIDDDEGNRMMRIVSAGPGRWRPSGGRRWCCASQGMIVQQIAKVAFTSENRGR
jgi:hypothetical protein